MYAGLKNSKGDYVVIMDVDLQDPPSLLPEMLVAVQKEGYDCAATRRVTRKGEPPIRSFFARMFYKVMRRISKTDVVDGARDYRLMKRKMVNAILDVGEYNRFSKGIFAGSVLKRKAGIRKYRAGARRNKMEASGSFWYILSTGSWRSPRCLFSSLP